MKLKQKLCRKNTISSAYITWLDCKCASAMPRAKKDNWSAVKENKITLLVYLLISLCLRLSYRFRVRIDRIGNAELVFVMESLTLSGWTNNPQIWEANALHRWTKCPKFSQINETTSKCTKKIRTKAIYLASSKAMPHLSPKILIYIFSLGTVTLS